MCALVGRDLQAALTAVQLTGAPDDEESAATHEAHLRLRLKGNSSTGQVAARPARARTCASVDSRSAQRIDGAMPHADVNGQRIRFDDSGGDGLPLILAHGFLMDREMFAPQVRELAPEFRVITWDERGFGETEFDGQPFTYWDSAADCLALLEHIGIEGAAGGGMA